MKNTLKLIGLAATWISATASTVAATPIAYNWTGSQTVPDNNASGVAFSFNVSAGGPLVITSVTVDLSIAGGWNGDLYAYLSHGSGFSVLLNRIGSTATNSGGSGVSGMNIELSDSYLTDIHTALNNPLSGNFAPDGRLENPLTVRDTDPRTALLGGFNGLDPNGTWTLFFADLSPLATSTIQSWTVNIGVTVPEPGSATILALGMIGLGLLRRSIKRD
jgi:subtilisin-like proprotein convertase family protein